MHLKELTSILIATLFLACGAEHDHHHSDAGEAVAVYSIPDMELNNGELWQANMETTDGVFAMIDLMDSFEGIENVSSYNELAETLQAEFNDIFRNCTMTGSAHDQLHNYLYPLKEIFEGLRSSELNICKASYSDLEQHLGLYFEYFENEH